MKKLYSLALGILMATGAMAQTAQKAKLAPVTRKYLNDYTQAKAKGTLPQGFIYKRITGGTVCVSTLVKVSDATRAQNGMRTLGAKVGTKAGNIWTVQVPAHQLQAFTQLPGIAYIQVDQPLSPNLDAARRTTKVDSVHAGYLLPMPYSGKNVVMGVIDFGFDYNHPTLYDTLGSHYRVRRVWELNTNGTPPAGYTYGHELTDTALIKAQGTDNPEQTHGTAVAGMAAGSGYGSTGNNRFRGMAYEADMVFVGVRRDTIGDQWMQGGFADFVDGIQYIFDYAATVGKPAVVNISWGSQSGPHDGSSLFNQACDNMAGNGRIIVMSAGNEGQEKIHLSNDFSPTDTLINTFLHFTSPAYKRTWVDVWGDTSKTFCAQVTLYNSSMAAGNTTGYICLDDNVHDTFLIAANGIDTCFVQFINSTAEYNMKPRMIMNIFNKAADSVNIKIKSTDGEIHLWDEYYFYGYKYGYQSEFRNLGQSWAISGNVTFTVSDMGAAESVLLVGAYASRVNFTDINGNSWTYAGYVPLNKLVPFSSRGPMTDGRIKPDITAPGLTIATSFSSYDTSYIPTGTNSSLVTSEYTDPLSLKKYYYCQFTGTSASAPAASGIVALMLQVNPSLGPQDIKDILFSTAITDGHTGTLPPQGNNSWGHGKINAYGAIRKVLQQLTSVQTFEGQQMDCMVYPNPNNGEFTVDYTAPAAQDLTLTVTDITGAVIQSVKWPVQPGQNRYSFNLQPMATGLYLVNITSAQGTMSVKTLVK